MQAGKALLRKVKGTENPANYLTKPQPGRGSHRLGEAFGKARAGKPAQSVEAGFPNQPFCGNRQCHLGTADPRSEGAAEGIKRNSSGGPFRRPCCWGEPEEEPSEPTSEPKEEAEDTLPAEEPPAEVATPPIAVEDLFRTPARAAPRDLRPPAPEPEPHHGDAGVATACAGRGRTATNATQNSNVGYSGRGVADSSQDHAYPRCRITTSVTCTTPPRDARFTSTGTVYRGTSSPKTSA